MTSDGLSVAVPQGSLLHRRSRHCSEGLPPSKDGQSGTFQMIHELVETIVLVMTNFHKYGKVWLQIIGVVRLQKKYGKV